MGTTITKYQEKNQDIEHFKTLASIASKGGSTGTMENLMNIMLTAKDLGISPMKAINGGFYIVKGKISMSTALMADRIRKEGHSIKIPEWTSKSCVIIGVRKDNGDSIKFEYTIEDAQAAGLTNSDTWKKYPKQMLYNRAMSTLARTLFPDVVGSAYSEDEKWDILDVPPEKRPLEDPDCIEISSENAPHEGKDFDCINDEEIQVINNLIKSLDEESEVNFHAWINKEFLAGNIAGIPKKGFERCVRSLTNKIKYLSDKNKEAVEVLP
jgi:RecT family